ncbi:hypothetical protein AB0395_40090 [Streptosporangium sp. NPDC051023]|uniref:hypothetical protein n=1 Tax=Streptosporangium sp. NPDC051023 TaxID=3155410 RepID=UPI00344F3736
MLSAGRTFSLVLSVALSTLALTGCSPHADGMPVSAQQMVHLLQTLLPQGKPSAQQGQGQGLSDQPVFPPSAQLVLDEGGNTATVKVSLTRWPVPVPAQYSQCPDTAYHPYSHCTQTLLPAGAELVLDRSPRNENHPNGAELLSALLTYKDGKQVFVSETGSSSDNKTVGLPLTLKQLATIATSAVWQPILAKMPAPPAGARTGSVARLSGRQISHIIGRLLPTGLRAAGEGGSDGFGHLTVDDGHGASLIAVNVQQWKPGDPAMTKLFHNAGTLPDGTRINTQQGPAPRGGAGTIEWTVDTLRRDGLRVVISAVNAGAYRLPASRGEPALTLDQLKQIALDPAWQQTAN